MSDHVTLTVVLLPGSGAELPPGGLTAGIVAEHAADPDAAARVAAYFAARGFEVGPFVALSFSITGPRRLALDVFGDVPEVGPLALDRLPDEIREQLLAVEAEPRPDFGPASFS